MIKEGQEGSENKALVSEEQAKQAKERYFKYFMVDFLEFNLRKVAVENTSYCAQKCNLFKNLDVELSKKDERKQFGCFETCLGKFSDSYEASLTVFGNHLKSINQKQVFSHSEMDKESKERRFLMGEGTLEPNGGGQLNELGSYSQCINYRGPNGDGMKYKYTLILLTSPEVFIGQNVTYAIGSCMPSNCDEGSINDMNSIIYSKELFTFYTKTNTKVVQQNPEDYYTGINEDNNRPGFWAMLSWFIILILFCIIGMIVQYSSFGDLKQKNKIDKVTIVEKPGKRYQQQYQELLIQNDKFLLNKKKIWATFFLCFSLPRNMVILFYDFEKSRKIGFIRMLKVVSFFWICFSFTYFWGFNTYPINFNDFPRIMSTPLSTILIAGVIFGFDMWIFHSAFQTMYEKLKMIHLRKFYYNPLLFAIKMFLQYVVPMNIVIAGVTTIFPFMGMGPIFPHFLEQNFLSKCATYWWTNVLLIQDIVPWDVQDTCGPHLFILAVEFQLMILLIPIFVFINQSTYWKFQFGLFFFISLCFSFVPILVLSLNNGTHAFPGLNTEGYQYLYSRVWFRVNPFLFGIALAVVKFEYKYMNKHYHGQFRTILDKLKQSNFLQMMSYFVGFVLCCLCVLILITDSYPAYNLNIKEIYPTKQKIVYGWGYVGQAIYNATVQYIFLTGLILMLLPQLIGNASKLRYVMSSHLWHVMEELTNSAYLICYICIAWFFASRVNDVLLSPGMLIMISISACLISYIMALPFYLLVERPFNNFLDLILFPRRAIFQKQKDIDTDSSSEDEKDQKQRGKDVEGPTGINHSGIFNEEEDLLQNNGKKQSPKKKVVNGVRFQNQIFACNYCSQLGVGPSLCKCNCMNSNEECKCDPQKQKQSNEFSGDEQIQSTQMIRSNSNTSPNNGNNQAHQNFLSGNNNSSSSFRKNRVSPTVGEVGKKVSFNLFNE